MESTEYLRTNNKIDIVFTTWKREKISDLALTALKRNTRTPYRLIIIDNGSNDINRSLYNQQADIYVRLDRNMGLEYAKWLGMTFVESPYFVSMDNDILVYDYKEQDWLSQLRDLMNKNPDYGAISLRPQVLVGTGNIFHERTEEIIPFSHAPGYGRIMRTHMVKEVGGWSDKRPLRGHEEYWIGEKFAEKGYKMGFANFVECYHLFGNQETDPWGYTKNSTPDSHGHTPVSSLPGNNKELILEKVGINI